MMFHFLDYNILLFFFFFKDKNHKVRAFKIGKKFAKERSSLPKKRQRSHTWLLKGGRSV